MSPPHHPTTEPGKVERPSHRARTEAREVEKYTEARRTDNAGNFLAEHEDLRQQPIAALHANRSTAGGEGTPVQEGEGVMDGAAPPIGRPRPPATNNTAFRREVASLRAELARLRAEGIATLAVGPPPAYD